MDKIINTIAEELNIKPNQVESTVKLIDEGNTIPFIARYRKEVTGGLSDEILRDLGERLTYLRNLEKRKEEIIKSIDEQGKLNDDIIYLLIGLWGLSLLMIFFIKLIIDRIFDNRKKKLTDMNDTSL